MGRSPVPGPDEPQLVELAVVVEHGQVVGLERDDAPDAGARHPRGGGDRAARRGESQGDLEPAGLTLLPDLHAHD
ncbi:MAG: hypothetical protein H0U79_06385, partial [Solirubrobacterales bacterium]|nr:hypothetical protein [Solirubrobacterales bacterium]